jgi:hypothetical protein
MFADPCIIVKFIKKKSKKIQQSIKIFIIPYLYEAQHVSGDTPPIIRSLKLHWQPLAFHTWKVVGRVVGGQLDVVHQLHVQQLPRMNSQRLPVQF